MDEGGADVNERTDTTRPGDAHGRTGTPPAHEFWQELLPPETSPRDGDVGDGSGAAYRDAYPAALPDGRRLPLPIRERGGGRTGLASLILNQASFAVQDALAEALTARIAAHRPDVVVGVPTLGLPLAEQVARRLGHSRLVALGTSRKFWYDETLSVPLTSVTSPGQTKRLYLDPRLRPLLDGRRVALIDDVVSTGRSIAAAVALLDLVGTRPAVIGCAMRQGEPRSAATFAAYPSTEVFRTPLLVRRDDDSWIATDAPDR